MTLEEAMQRAEEAENYGPAWENSRVLAAEITRLRDENSLVTCIIGTRPNSVDFIQVPRYLADETLIELRQACDQKDAAIETASSAMDPLSGVIARVEAVAIGLTKTIAEAGRLGRSGYAVAVETQAKLFYALRVEP